MNTTCTYIFPTKYDILIRQAFNLVESFIDTELDDISEYGKIGVPQEDRLLDLRNYYYLINYMIYVRQKIDQYIIDSGNGCITQTEIDQYKDLYKTDCIISNKVCKQYTNQIINLFLTLPNCDATPTYDWTINDVCFEIDGTEYAIGVTLQKKLNGIVVETFYIAPEATSSDIQTIVGVDSTTADQLILNRLISPDSSFCCNEPVYNAPILEVVDATESTIDIQWVSNALLYTVTISNTSGEILETVSEIEETYVQFTGLDSNTEYTIEVTALSCSQNNSSNITLETGPYTVTVTLDSSIVNQITLNGATQVDVEYNGTFNISWLDSGEPFFIVNEVLVNEVLRPDTLVYTTPLVGTPANIRASGNITIPNIISDTQVVLSGIPGNTCTTIKLENVDNNLTLSFFALN
jgi:hypothetical protein